MLKNVSKFEVSIDGRTYHLLCESDSPTSHVKEFIFQITKYIGMIEDQAKAKAQEEATKKESANTEVPNPEA